MGVGLRSTSWPEEGHPLLADLATLTRNLVVLPGAPDEPAFEITATPTPLQARAFELLGLSPAGT